MSNATTEQIDNEILRKDISDESLEKLAAPEQAGGAYTLGFCTGLSACPG
jgi:hypothetical protein